MVRLSRSRSVFLTLVFALLWQALVPGGVFARAVDSAGAQAGPGLNDVCFGDGHRASQRLWVSEAPTTQTDESVPSSAGQAGHCDLCGVSLTPATPTGDAALTHVQAPGGTLVARTEPVTPPSAADWRTPESRGPPVSIH